MAEKDNRALSEQEAEFCRQIVYARLPQYKAYMAAWPGCTKTTASVQAHGVMRRQRVIDEIAKLREEKSRDAEWELMDHIYELKAVIQEPENQTAKVNALKELGKVFGWDKSTINHTSEDGSMSPAAGDAVLEALKAKHDASRDS